MTTIGVRLPTSAVVSIDERARRERRKRSELARALLLFGLSVAADGGMKYEDLADRAEPLDMVAEKEGEYNHPPPKKEKPRR